MIFLIRMHLNNQTWRLRTFGYHILTQRHKAGGGSRNTIIKCSDKRLSDRLRDPVSCLSLATRVNSRNLVFIFYVYNWAWAWIFPKAWEGESWCCCVGWCLFSVFTHSPFSMQFSAVKEEREGGVSKRAAFCVNWSRYLETRHKSTQKSPTDESMTQISAISLKWKGKGAVVVAERVESMHKLKNGAGLKSLNFLKLLALIKELQNIDWKQITL